MRCYISGPITGMPGLNKPAFAEAARLLSDHGLEPVNPHCNGVEPQASWEQHMRADIALLVTCEAIYLLPGWENSRGATLELHIARALGMWEISALGSVA